MQTFVTSGAIIDLILAVVALVVLVLGILRRKDKRRAGIIGTVQKAKDVA